MQRDYRLLCPRPKQLEPRAGELVLTAAPRLEVHGCSDSPAERQLRECFARSKLSANELAAPRVSLSLEAGDPTSEAYTLEIGADGMAIRASGSAGLFYGVCTLSQLLALGAQDNRIVLPHLAIRDEPSFTRRGVMLDISRDKVPTLATVLGLVELFAALKLNELQLYMEHTFAYTGHERVWADASPFTGAEIEELDRFCRERHIDLVPNQNSFGHMQRWLAIEPYRSDLAEAPNGFEHAWNPTREPYGLCPTEPRSLSFLSDLHGQLLPHFSSKLFNVGLDETFDLGLGRSKLACEERGTERVYLDFLKQIHEMTSRRGRIMQFWGDIILKCPELIPELPKDAIALEWGYEHDHPFAEHVEKFAAAGLRFYVCPGTSSWNSIAGRAENALLNIASAVKHGRAHGALGVLNTDWGDNGHLQPLCASYVGFLAGAAMSWRAEDAEAPLELPLVQWLDAYIYGDCERALGKLTYDLGNAYRELGTRPHNSSALFFFIAGRSGEPILLPETQASHFDACIDYLSKIDAELVQLRPTSNEARLAREELIWASDVMKTACRIGRARLDIGFERPICQLAAGTRERLAAELAPLIERHRALWATRNRPGGLRESAGQMERVLRELRSVA